MTETLASPPPGTGLQVAALTVQAVAYAFAMLGLVAADAAGTAMRRAHAALEQSGIGGSQIETWPGQEGDYWALRARGPGDLAWAPRAVAVGTLPFRVPGADLRCDWFRAARAGLRFQLQATAAGGQPPEHLREVLADLSAADDGARPYRLRWDGGRGSRRLWIGDVVATAVPDPGRPPEEPAWFALAASDGQSGRVELAPPAAIAAGPAAPPQPTPAESYLDWLSRQYPEPELGQAEGRRVVAAVAEGLVAVGAIPADSPLLPPILGRQRRSSHPGVPRTWPRPVRLGTRPDLQIALGAALPLDHAVAIVEGVSGWGEDIQIHLYGWPWVQGRRWPAAMPSFRVMAIDDLDGEHEGHPGYWRSYGGGEARGEFTLWPAVPRRAARLRVVVSTLWEAGWADIEMSER